jgi:hypothetical protein
MNGYRLMAEETCEDAMTQISVSRSKAAGPPKLLVRANRKGRYLLFHFDVTFVSQAR